ncbi:hypothetical protein [Pseudomonas sp. nanlin1]|uniref:hypothetical protein n=1 Tax=Pseudomonas sp. nanlin1 TaxID=3040605 RepID=UPI0038907359
MKFFKSLVLATAVVSATAVVAEDGSERSNQMLLTLRLAQEARMEHQNNNQLAQHVLIDDQSSDNGLKQADC